MMPQFVRLAQRNRVVLGGRHQNEVHAIEFGRGLWLHRAAAHRRRAEQIDGAHQHLHRVPGQQILARREDVRRFGQHIGQGAHQAAGHVRQRFDHIGDRQRSEGDGIDRRRPVTERRDGQPDTGDAARREHHDRSKDEHTH